MRVVMLTFYPSDPNLVPGGIRMVAYNLVQALQTYEDLDLHVLHCHSDIVQDRIAVHGRATLHYLALPRRRVVPNLITGIRRVTSALREIGPALVHAHAPHFAYAATKAGYPTVYTIHGLPSRERQVYSESLFDRLRYGLLYRYEVLALPRVQHLVAVSPYVMQEYAQMSNLRWSRIDNPVPVAFFDLPDESEPGRVLYAGSITEIKDVLTLLRAIERLRSSYPQVRLHIAGRVTSEAYARRVYAYVQEHRLDGAVSFLGLLDRQAMLQEYRRCTVVALSSVQENAPMTIIEAMAAGKPVVATRVGGVPDLVQDGETGYMVRVGDAEQMAERLELVLGNAGLAVRLGQRGRELARQRFGAKRIAELYHDLYRQVLEESHRKQGSPDAPVYTL